jgi:hypothetical protein
VKTTILKKDRATGRVYLRESMLVAFFLPPPIHESVDGLRKAFELYMKMIPPGALTWSVIGASTEEWSPVGKQTISRALQQLDPKAAKARKLTSFQLTDGEVGGDAPGYGVEVLGRPRIPDRPDTTSFLEMSFPMETVEPSTAERFVDFCKQVAALIPYTSGYASPALQWAELGRGRAAAASKAIALRHPGYDVHVNSSTSNRIRARTRGARWLTFLADDLVEEVGGQERLRKALSAAIKIEKAGDGVMIRAGDMPEIGDVNKRQGTPLLREVAAALEPVSVFDDPALLGNFANHDEDLLKRWERRLLD